MTKVSHSPMRSDTTRVERSCQSLEREVHKLEGDKHDMLNLLNIKEDKIKELEDMVVTLSHELSTEPRMENVVKQLAKCLEVNENL